MFCVTVIADKTINVTMKITSESCTDGEYNNCLLSTRPSDAVKYPKPSFFPYFFLQCCVNTFVRLRQVELDLLRSNPAHCVLLLTLPGFTALRWLDTGFKGQYLSSLSINFVAKNKDLGKLPPQLYQLKMKICYDQECNDIEVVIATK